MLGRAVTQILLPCDPLSSAPSGRVPYGGQCGLIWKKFGLKRFPRKARSVQKCGYQNFSAKATCFNLGLGKREALLKATCSYILVGV